MTSAKIIALEVPAPCPVTVTPAAWLWSSVTVSHCLLPLTIA